jgi:predicted outer membrane repeat protein
MERNKSIQTAIRVCVLSLTLSAASPARTLYVDDDAPADFRTIQAAIDDANNGDTIIVQPGVYTGSGNRDIDFKGKAIVVRSEQGAQTCILNCQGSLKEPHRGFYLHSGEDANSVIQGFTITGGFAAGNDWVIVAGGGILCHASSPRITDCVTRGNSAAFAGGIACIDSNSVIANCIISGNDTRSGWGWPLSWREGTGGGICLEGAHPMLVNCLVTGNRARDDGGGIACAGNFVIRNCTVSGNRASGGAGGIFVRVWNRRDSLGVLGNCIVWDNVAPWCPQIAFPVTGVVAHGTAGLQLSYCVVQDPGPSCQDHLWGIGTSVEPLFASAGYWDPNGTPNKADDDFWVDGDYHLRSQAGRWDPARQSWVKDDVTSPCIDAGDPNSTVGDEPQPNGGRVNIGVHGGTAEASKSYFPDAPSTKIIDVDDDANGADDGSSWGNAHRYLQDALAAASAGEMPVEVRVARGIYRPDQGASVPHGDRDATFHLTGGMTLRGGYAGVGASDPNVRDVALHETILSGDLEGNDAPEVHVLTLPADPTRADNSRTIATMADNEYFPGVLDGFTVNSANGRSALRVSLLRASVRDCTFADNASGAVVVSLGGAQAEFTNCRFLRNVATQGGALYTAGRDEYSSPAAVTISGCTFTENHAADVGGALLLRASNSTLIQNCAFVRNSARYGAGACLDGGKPVNMVNCLLAGNRATYQGGGVYLRGQDLHTTCCTFVGNRAKDGRAVARRFATYMSPSATATLTNTILRDGGYELFGGIRGESNPSVTYSDGEQGWHGEGNIDVDPLFADAGHWDANGTPDDPNDDFFVEGDYYLRSQAGRWDPVSESWVLDQVTSPCIDAGDPNSPVGDEPQPNGGRVNMGVYGGTAEASKSYVAPQVDGGSHRQGAEKGAGGG